MSSRPRPRVSAGVGVNVSGGSDAAATVSPLTPHPPSPLITATATPPSSSPTPSSSSRSPAPQLQRLQDRLDSPVVISSRSTGFVFRGRAPKTTVTKYNAYKKIYFGKQKHQHSHSSSSSSSSPQTPSSLSSSSPTLSIVQESASSPVGVVFPGTLVVKLVQTSNSAAARSAMAERNAFRAVGGQGHPNVVPCYGMKSHTPSSAPLLLLSNAHNTNNTSSSGDADFV